MAEKPNYDLATGPETYYDQGMTIVHIASGNKIVFDKVFLTSFTDSRKTNFKSTTVYGRMDPLINYQNTARTINISFVLPASWEKQAEENFQKLQTLALFQYPSYTNPSFASGLQTPPICKVKYKNFINENGDFLYGFFAGFEFTPVNEAGYFLDEYNNPEAYTGNMYPKEYKVSLSFTVLHTSPVGWKGNNNIASQSNSAGDSNSSAVDEDTDPKNAADAADVGK